MDNLWIPRGFLEESTGCPQASDRIAPAQPLWMNQPVDTVDKQPVDNLLADRFLRCGQSSGQPVESTGPVITKAQLEALHPVSDTPVDASDTPTPLPGAGIRAIRTLAPTPTPRGTTGTPCACRAAQAPAGAERDRLGPRSRGSGKPPRLASSGRGNGRPGCSGPVSEPPCPGPPAAAFRGLAAVLPGQMRDRARITPLRATRPVGASPDGSGGPLRDSRVAQHEAGHVVDQPAGEIELGRGVVVALMGVFAGGPQVHLFEPPDGEIGGPNVGRGRRDDTRPRSPVVRRTASLSASQREPRRSGADRALTGSAV